MTTINFDTKTCALCGHESTFAVLGSTNAFGSPDLDLRPPEMQRSTMEYWVEACESCGYRSHDISELIDDAPDIVRSEPYQRQLEDSSCPPLANSFLCYALIQENAGEFSSAGQSAIHAAWACDDAEMTDAARSCRERAVSLLRRARAHEQIEEDPPGAAEALMVDLMRRSERFDEAREICRDGLQKTMEPVIADVLRFQQSLIDKHDTGAYSIEDAVQSGKDS